MFVLTSVTLSENRQQGQKNQQKTRFYEVSRSEHNFVVSTVTHQSPSAGASIK